MKRVLMAVGLGLVTGSLWAACMGPYCYDDTGASINGYSMTGNGMDFPTVSSATLNTMSHPAGRTVICNNCTIAATPGYVLCYATSAVAGVNSFIVINSTNGVTVCK